MDRRLCGCHLWTFCVVGGVCLLVNTILFFVPRYINKIGWLWKAVDIGEHNITPTYYISIDAESNYLSWHFNPYMPIMIIQGINAIYNWRMDLIGYSVEFWAHGLYSSAGRHPSSSCSQFHHSKSHCFPLPRTTTHPCGLCSPSLQPLHNHHGLLNPILIRITITIYLILPDCCCLWLSLE